MVIADSEYGKCIGVYVFFTLSPSLFFSDGHWPRAPEVPGANFPFTVFDIYIDA
jgi:hypothetical protein